MFVFKRPRELLTRADGKKKTVKKPKLVSVLCFLLKLFPPVTLLCLQKESFRIWFARLSKRPRSSMNTNQGLHNRREPEYWLFCATITTGTRSNTHIHMYISALWSNSPKPSVNLILTICTTAYMHTENVTMLEATGTEKRKTCPFPLINFLTELSTVTDTTSQKTVDSYKTIRRLVLFACVCKIIACVP